jgi:hypothetical protein
MPRQHIRDTDPSVDDVVAGWIRHFWSADQGIQWQHSERELFADLAPGLTIGGYVDADGCTGIATVADAPFFGEWKSANPRGKSGWREKWRFHPQTLTYGLLMRENNVSMKRFTIRMAFKSNPPSFDHEWFEYSDGEMDMWRDELLRIGSEISALSATTLEHWPINPLSCHRFGPNYPCERLRNCTKQLWNEPIPGAVVREPNPAFEQRRANGTLVLSPTGIEKYLECNENYRGQYILNEVEPPSESLSFGKQFHALLGEYYRKRAAGETFDEQGAQVTWPNH